MNRDKILELIDKMRARTVDRGCTPAEAAAFAAKIAEWIERYQITAEELRRSGSAEAEAIEVCENILRTGKRVHNPGMTAVVAALARGMCCEIILLYPEREAAYGITGEVMDATYVCQLATTVVPALQVMARLEGAERGHERAALVRWTNQYLTGAACEIQRRLESERAERSAKKEAERRAAGGSTALIVVTGEVVAAEKREAARQAFREKYPRTRKTRSRAEYDPDAQESGREAGRRVGLKIGIAGE